VPDVPDRSGRRLSIKVGRPHGRKECQMSQRKIRRTRGLALGLLISWGASPSCTGLLFGDETPGELPPNALPAPVEIETASFAAAGDEVGPVEKVQERFDNRTLKVERHVAQDAEGNFFNHGPYAEWDAGGRLVGRGLFLHGKRHGKWTRTHGGDEAADVYAAELQKGFDAPFTSTAEFDDGKLHGTWIVLDAKKRQVSAAEFSRGQRHGKSIAWFPGGKKHHEVDYRNGELDGLAKAFDADEKLLGEERFVAGFRHGVKTELYESGAVKSECETLFAKQVFTSEDDFWGGRAEVSLVGTIGRDQRHGRFVAWNEAGQKVLEGQYVDDLPDGKFTWWHDNGNKAIEGTYVDGKQDGLWTWWYSNGLKEIVGEYVKGEEGGHWRSWEEDGRVAGRMSIFFGASAGDGDGDGEEAGTAPAAPTTEEVGLEQPPQPSAEEVGFEQAPQPSAEARKASLEQASAEGPLEAQLIAPEPAAELAPSVPARSQAPTLAPALLPAPPVPSTLQVLGASTVAPDLLPPPPMPTTLQVLGAQSLAPIPGAVKPARR
jgi:antitoxin component YwqK of YwqJK toxin-antitoxin module